MALIHRKTLVNLTATLLVALALFSFGIEIVRAQEVSPDDILNESSEIQAQNAGTDTGEQVIGFSTIGGFVYEGLTSIGGLVISLGGRLLDVSLTWFVFGMADTMEQFLLTDVVSDVWELVRDLFNLLFIFGLIFIGFKIILDIDDSGSKKTLVTIVLAALLINFSLYISQVVIDFSNIAAAQIGSQFIPSASTKATVFGMEIKNISSGFIAATDMQNLSSTTLSKVNELSTGQIALPTRELGVGHALAMGLTIALMLVLIGYVFAAGALIMFTRFMYLLFLMMFSPLMFLGFVLPAFQQRSKDWWRTLFYQAFVGPAYLFMLFIALRALESLVNSGVMKNDVSITAFVISSLIVSAFAWAALMAAQKMGAAGADTAIKTGQSWGRSIRGGVTGYAGRNTLGRLGDAYNRRLDERGVSDKSLRRGIASKLAGSKYGSGYSQADARGSEEKAAQKRGRYDQVQKINSAISAGHTARTGKTRIDMEKAIIGASNDQIIEMLSKHKADSPEYQSIVEHMSASQFDAVLKAKPEDLNDKAIAKIKEKRQGFVKTAVTADGGIGISKASDAQLKVLGATEIEKNAESLKQSQFDDIMKSKDYTETEKSNIREAREKGLEKRFNNDSEREEMFKEMQDKDIASLPKKILLDDNGRSVRFITGGALKKIAEDDKLAEADRVELRENIRVRDGIDAKSSAIKYLKSPQGQEKYGEWPE